MWQIVITCLSLILFFGFVGVGVSKFNLLDCYSAYGEQWGDNVPISGGLNLWTVITVLSAFMMVPPLVDAANGSLLQFTGFVAPTSLLLVGITPYYKYNKLDWWLHQIGAWCAVLWVLVYIIFVAKLAWIIALFVILSVILSWIFGWKKWMFWAEMCTYLGIYITLFLIIS